MALRAKIESDEAELEGCGGPTVEGENEVWLDFRRNPKGPATFPNFCVNHRWQTPCIRHSSRLELEKTDSRRHRPVA
jgi:hypothetical protein